MPALKFRRCSSFLISAAAVVTELRCRGRARARDVPLFCSVMSTSQVCERLLCLLAAVLCLGSAAFVDTPYNEDIASKFVLQSAETLPPWGVLPPAVSSPILGAVSGRLVPAAPKGYFIYGAFGVVFVNFTTPETPITRAAASFQVAVPPSVLSGSAVSAVAVDGNDMLIAAVTDQKLITLSCNGSTQ